MGEVSWKFMSYVVFNRGPLGGIENQAIVDLVRQTDQEHDLSISRVKFYGDDGKQNVAYDGWVEVESNKASLLTEKLNGLEGLTAKHVAKLDIS